MQHKLWPNMICGKPSQELELHDIQFQLCEFDKYCRAKHGEGVVKKYKPRAHSMDSESTQAKNSTSSCIIKQERI